MHRQHPTVPSTRNGWFSGVRPDEVSVGISATNEPFVRGPPEEQQSSLSFPLSRPPPLLISPNEMTVYRQPPASLPTLSPIAKLSGSPTSLATT